MCGDACPRRDRRCSAVRAAEASRRRLQPRRRLRPQGGRRQGEAAEAGQDRQLDALRLRRRAQQVPRLAAGPAPLPEGLEVEGQGADRVSADRRRRPPLLHRQRRRLCLPLGEDREGDLEEAARFPERLVAGVLQGRPLQRQPLAGPGARGSRPRRQGPLAQAARRPRRVLAAGPEGADVLRQRSGAAPRARHQGRIDGLGDGPRRIREGRTGVRRRQPLRRRLRRQDERRPRQGRQARLADLGPRTRHRRLRSLLLDGSGRVRPRLRRRRRQPRLQLRCRQRRDRLDLLGRRLRLLRDRRGGHEGHRPDRLLRLPRPQRLRARREERQAQVVGGRRRADQRPRHGRRRCRLRLDVQRQLDDRPRPRDRPPGLQLRRR